MLQWQKELTWQPARQCKPLQGITEASTEMRITVNHKRSQLPSANKQNCRKRDPRIWAAVCVYHKSQRDIQPCTPLLQGSSRLNLVPSARLQNQYRFSGSAILNCGWYKKSSLQVDSQPKLICLVYGLWQPFALFCILHMNCVKSPNDSHDHSTTVIFPGNFFIITSLYAYRKVPEWVRHI